MNDSPTREILFGHGPFSMPFSMPIADNFRRIRPSGRMSREHRPVTQDMKPSGT